MFGRTLIATVAAGAVVTAPALVNETWHSSLRAEAAGATTARSAEAWEQPTAISAPWAASRDVYTSTDVVVDAAGNTTAAWANEIGVGAARRPAGGHWRKPVRLGRKGYDVRVDADARGNVTIVWYGFYSGRVMTVRRLATGRWTHPVALSENEDYLYPMYLQLDVNPRGAAVASWWYGDGDEVIDGFGRAEAVYRPAHGRWSAPHVLARRIEQDDTAVAIDARGNVTAVFDDARYRIHAARRVVGRGWLASVRISADQRQRGWPEVVVDARGNATATWIGWRYQLMVASRPRYRHWSPSVSLAAPVGEGLLGVDRAGTVVVVYTHYNVHTATTSAIRTRSKPPHGAWEPSETIVPADGNDRYLGEMAMNPRGDTLLTWVSDQWFSSYRPQGSP